jgi:hypothetical protein
VVLCSCRPNISFTQPSLHTHLSSIHPDVSQDDNTDRLTHGPSLKELDSQPDSLFDFHQLYDIKVNIKRPFDWFQLPNTDSQMRGA